MLGVLFVIFSILVGVAVTAFFLFGRPLVLIDPYPDFILDLDDT